MGIAIHCDVIFRGEAMRTIRLLVLLFAVPVLAIGAEDDRLYMNIESAVAGGALGVAIGYCSGKYGDDTNGPLATECLSRATAEVPRSRIISVAKKIRKDCQSSTSISSQCTTDRITNSMLGLIKMFNTNRL
jgi:hypothetical protein